MIDNLEFLKEKLLHLLPKQGRLETEIPGLAISRFDQIIPAKQCFYSPMIALVVQGYKRAMIAGHEVGYGQGYYALVGVDVPGVYQIGEAAPDAPFLALSVKLNRQIISQLIHDAPYLVKNHAACFNPAVTSKASNEILDVFRRLINLLDSPERTDVLAPMLIREIHFYLLESSQGNCLRIFNTVGTNANQIARAIALLKENFVSALNMDNLAQKVNMSPSTFYRHFKEVTGLSPLQFQKQLRLHEAERLMLCEGEDAGRAAMLTGYESVSHFSRDYKRHFGDSPHRDVAKKSKESTQNILGQ